MQGMITRRCLDDIASAIRLRTHTSGQIAPNDMPMMVGRVYGPPMEMPERSNDNSIGLVSDSCMSAIADAIRGKLGTDDLIAPKDMADAILSIDLKTPFDVIAESTEIIRNSSYAIGSGVNRKSSTYDNYAYYYTANDNFPSGYILDSREYVHNSDFHNSTASMLNAFVPAWCTKLFLYMESGGASGKYNTSTMWFKSLYGIKNYRIDTDCFAGKNVRDTVTFTRYSGTATQTNEQNGVTISVNNMYAVQKQLVEVDISDVDQGFYIGLHRCDNRTVFYGIIAAWDGFDALNYLGVS